MDNKTLSITSYLTIIGWLVAYFVGKDKADSLLKYHLRQSLGLMIVAFIVNVLITFIIISIPTLYSLNYISYIFIVLWVLGLFNAINGVEKPIPLIGKYFEKIMP